MTEPIEGILFDLGDTLLDFGPLDVQSLFEAGARLAYDYLKELGQPLPTFAKYHRKQLWAIRWNYFKSHLRRREFNALDLIGRLSARMGHDLNHEQTVELAWLWYHPLGDCASVEDGLRDILGRFRDAGLMLGIVSNTFVPSEVLDRHLKKESLLDLLPVRVYSCEVGYRKPNGNIFKIALRRAELTAARTLFVGDSPRADIDGANRAGLISVLKDPAGRYAASKIKPRHRIRRMRDLVGIVSQYNGVF